MTKNNNTNIPAGYKSSELGVIPEGWQVKRLGEICKTFKSGQSITSQNIADDGLYPVYGGNGLRGFTHSYTHSGSYVLIGRQGALCGNVNYVEGDTYISEHAIAVQTEDNCDLQWLKYKLDFWNLNRFSESSAQPGLSVEKLVRYQLSVPSLGEQERIAEILGTWDRAIELQGQKVALLQSRKRALMQQLLTRHRRRPNFSEPWKTTKLGEIAERVTRKNTENNLNVMTISAQRGFVSQTDFFNKSIASEITDNYFLVHKDEFCYNKSYCNGYPMGAIKRLNSAEKAVVTTLYICFRIKCDKCDIEFLEQYFEAGLLNKNLMKIANEGGRAHGLLNVTPSDFFAMSFEIPSLDEQRAIAEVLTTADREIELATQNLTALRSQKRALMQQLLTGKKQVKTQSYECKINKKGRDFFK